MALDRTIVRPILLTPNGDLALNTARNAEELGYEFEIGDWNTEPRSCVSIHGIIDDPAKKHSAVIRNVPYKISEHVPQQILYLTPQRNENIIGVLYKMGIGWTEKWTPRNFTMRQRMLAMKLFATRKRWQIQPRLA